MNICIVADNAEARIVGSVPTKLEESLLYGLGYYKKVMVPQKGADGKMVYLHGRPHFKLEDKLCPKYHRIKQTTPVGLLERMITCCRELDYPVKLTDERHKALLSVEDVRQGLRAYGPIVLRPYQVRAVLTGSQEPLMTFGMATASGKTQVFIALSDILGLKTLILVNREDILTQHITLLQDILGDRRTIGVIHGDTLDFKADVCVGMVQTIHARLQQKGKRLESPASLMRQYLKSVGYLISDESHHGQSDTWRRASDLCYNARYKHGFSGSPWDAASANIELEAVCGPVKVKVTSSDLIKMGYISKPKITFHDYPGNKKRQLSQGNFQQVYSALIVDNQERNQAIVDIATKYHRDTNHKMLIVVNRIKHGGILTDMLIESGIDSREIGYLHGSKAGKIRQRGKEKFERGQIRILVVSQIWNEGIDVPTCDVLIKADALGGGDNIADSEGVRAFVQQIGRILRKPRPEGGDVDTGTEHIVYVHDFLDGQHRFLLNWTNNRLRTCKMEDEFDVIMA